MLKIPAIKKQLEQIFKKSKLKYLYLNKEYKNLSMPLYMVGLPSFDDKTKEVTEVIPVMVPIFKSMTVIYFECFNIYKASRNNYTKALKSINRLNQYAFPGRFYLTDDYIVSYRIILDYSKLKELDSGSIQQFLDSILPAYYIFLEEMRKRTTNEP